MSNFPFFIFTRIGLGSRTPSYFKNSLGLFQAVTLPSIKGQTDQDFHWLIFVGTDMPADALDQLLSLVETCPQAHLVPVDMSDLHRMQIGGYDWVEPYFFRLALGKGWVQNVDDFIITVQIDCDDAWHRDSVSEIKKNCSNICDYLISTEASKKFTLCSTSGAALTFSTGFTWFPLERTLDLTVENFKSMSCVVFSRFSSGVYTTSSRHPKWVQFCDVVQFLPVQMESAGPMWLYTRHVNNHSRLGPKEQGRTGDRDHLEAFNIDLNALEVWRQDQLSKTSQLNDVHHVGCRQNTNIKKLTYLNIQIDILKNEFAINMNQTLRQLLDDAVVQRDLLLQAYRAESFNYDNRD